MKRNRALWLLMACAMSISTQNITVSAMGSGGSFRAPEASAEPAGTLQPTAAADPDTAAETAGLPSAETEETPLPSSSEAPASAVPEESAPSASAAPAETGFPGLPEGYELNAEQMQAKALLASSETGALKEMETAEAGKDYVPQQILFLADSPEWAQAVSEAYAGTLISCENGVAVVKLADDATVKDAVIAAADPSTNLPAVDPNYLVTTGPVVETGETDDYGSLGLVTAVPETSMWADYAGKDPFLQTSDSSYQYQHENADVYAAWGTTMGSSDVLVAVLDSGVNSSQEDLAGRISFRKVFNAENLEGYTAGDHGTHVAGIIGAVNGNGKGGSGIAPEVKMWDLQCLSAAGEGSTYDIVSAYIYATNRYARSDGSTETADIVSMSLGGYGYSVSFQTAINNAAKAGIVTVVAAGNDGTNGRPYPAGYQNVICVGALNKDNSRANYSNYGSWVDIAAPGTGIYSTYSTSSTAYGVMSGTSQATPVVSGSIALYMSAAGRRNGDVNGDGYRDAKDTAQVESVLKKTAQKTGLADMGAGCVDAGAMIATVIAPPVISASVGGAAVTDFSKTLVVPASGSAVMNIVTDMAVYYIAYTTDGTTPSVKNGILVNGSTYTGSISLASLGNGRITVKAIAVSGSGLVSAVKSQTLLLQQEGSAASRYITIGGPKYAGRGSSIQLTATLLDGSKTGVNWSIESGSGAAISSSGLLKISAAASGVITVKAASKANSYYSNTYTVTVNPLITSVTLTEKYGRPSGTVITSGTDLQLSASVKAGSQVLNSGYALLWTSSNPKIASVDQNGKVLPAGKGSVTITAKATDGSGKSATYKMNVQLLVTGITLTPATFKVAAGRTVKFSAAVAPSAASNSGLNWSVDENARKQKVTISTSGVLSIPAQAKISTVTVTASAKDGSGRSAGYSITVLPAAAKSITMALNSRDSSHGVFTNGRLTGITLLTCNPSGNKYAAAGSNAVSAVLSAYTDTGSATPVVYQSSDPSVAAVNNATITAIRAGKTTITAAAQDGSGMKVSVPVTVLVPVSDLTIGTKSAVSMATFSSFRPQGYLYLAAGASAALQVRGGTLYGRPTDQSVLWSVDQAASNLGVTISSAGTLRVPMSANDSLKSGARQITVTAAAKDGSNKTATFPVYLTARISAFLVPAANYSFRYYSFSDGKWYSYTQPRYYRSQQADQYLGFLTDSGDHVFTVTGTTGSITCLGCYPVGTTTISGRTYYFYVCELMVDHPYADESSAYYSKITSGSIKITAADGTNMSRTASVKIIY